MDTTTLPLSKSRISWVDGARVIAILLVLQNHTTCSYILNQDSVAGAVAVFFLMSGYFTKSNTLLDSIKRVCRLIPFYVLWCLYSFVIENHGFDFDYGSFFHAILHRGCGAMWFILFLIYFTFIGYVANKLPYLLRGIAIAILFAYGTWKYSMGGYAHPCMNFSFALSIFLLGQLGNIYSLQKWQSILFPSNNATCILLPSLSFASILIMSALDITLIPSCLLLLLSMWSILCLSYAIVQQFPQTKTSMAQMGEAVVFIYAFHMPTLRAMTSFHLQLTDTMPHCVTSLFFIVILFFLGVFTFHFLKGRQRILDALLFAR